MACPSTPSTLLPSDGVRTHQSHHLLAFLLAGRQPTCNLSRHYRAASSFLACFTPQSRRLTHSGHGGQSQGYTDLHRRKRPSLRETWGMFCVLASLVPKPSQAQARISTSCSPCAAITSLQRVVCSPATPDIPLGFTVHKVVSISTRLSLPCPIVLHACHSAEGAIPG
ncbi:hypothetical protein N431DRAFT_139352 [Stipitochalara longipes BDJ]|nr:hypothetical protein N431DRAFT_139352 [Stipitochalara longipes BDJ]